MNWVTTTGNTIELGTNYDSFFDQPSKEINININIKLPKYEDPYLNDYNRSSACDKCSNNPKNGGSGVCFCTLGTPVIY